MLDIGYVQEPVLFHTYVQLNTCLTMNDNAVLDGISGYGHHRSIHQAWRNQFIIIHNCLTVELFS